MSNTNHVRIINQRERLPGETDDQYIKRMRQITNRARRTTHRTVAQGKREAIKKRNQLRNREHCKC